MYLLCSEIDKVMVIYKRTLCRSVRFVVIFVVDKLDSRCAVVQFCQSFVNHTQNWTPLGPITIINRVFPFFSGGYSPSYVYRLVSELYHADDYYL